MVTLLPRLPGPAAQAIVRQFLDRSPSTWSGFNPRELPEAIRFAATGGSPVSDQQLQDFRLQLEDLARGYGYGSNETSRSAFDRFDAEAAAVLAQESILSSGEALRDDVWSFVGAVVAPDIVHWRFGTAVHRYLGGVRNTFQRLWMRGRALDRGADHPDRWMLLDALSEDALVQITERPSIGADPVLALAVGEAWLRAARHYGRSSMEPVMRHAVLRVRIRNEIRNLSELPVEDLNHLLDELFGTPAPARADIPAGETLDLPASRLQGGMNEQKPSGSIAAVHDTDAPLSEAVDRIIIEANRRGWLSPKSRSALDELAGGIRSLETSQVDAVDDLLGRLSRAGILKAEVDQARETIAVRSGSRTRKPEPSGKRRSRWAIWRTR